MPYCTCNRTWCGEALVCSWRTDGRGLWPTDPRNPASCQVVMTVWSYFAAVMTDPGRVPEGWSPFPDEQVWLGLRCAGRGARSLEGLCGASKRWVPSLPSVAAGHTQPGRDVCSNGWLLRGLGCPLVAPSPQCLTIQTPGSLRQPPLPCPPLGSRPGRAVRAGAAGRAQLPSGQERPPAAAVLQALPRVEARARAPLQRHGALRLENGSLLHLGGWFVGGSRGPLVQCAFAALRC